MKRLALIALAVLAIAAIFMASGCKPRQKTKEDTAISVSVGYARTGDISSVVEISGDMKALKTTMLSAKSSGRVVSVPYREGDRIGAGATVVAQDTSDLRTGVLQAEAALESARARLSQASTSAGVSDTQIEAQVAQAKAGLDVAKANLRMLKAGARTQERAQAQNAVTTAKANYDNAKADYDRMKSLYEQGALSPKQWDVVQTSYRVAQAQYDSAKQALSLVEAGAREEQIEAAEKQVAQAQESLRLAQTGRSQKSLRIEDVKAAKAGVAQAAASLSYARQQLANAYIRTPIAGTVSARNVEPGQMASTGTPLIQVVALDSIYFEAAVSEMDVDRVMAGQPVEVTIDALPGRKFRGTVQKILPTADPKSRQFTMRITVLNKTGEIRPGMFARGSIEVAKHKNTVLVPKDAVAINGRGFSVYIVSQSKARLQPVTAGFTTREEVEILSGVSVGDELVVVGQDRLSDGVKVNVAD